MSDIGVSIGQKFDSESVIIIGVNISENLELIRKFIAAFGIDFTVLMADDSVGLDYQQPLSISPFPLDYIIDQQGKVAYHNTEYDPRQMTEVITNLLSTVSVDEDISITPFSFQLEQNYPNPFNPATTLEYTLQNSGEVSLIIYNLLGQEAVKLINEVQQAGHHEVTWNAYDFASGIYFYRLQASDFVQTRKMVLLK